MSNSENLSRRESHDDKDDESFPIDALFEEPDHGTEQAKPFTYYTFETGSHSIKVRLIGQSPLWGHLIWNSSIELCRHLERRHLSYILPDTSVLELGAGAGLPSLVCAKLGARRVVATDFPDTDLLDNLRWNVRSFEEAIAVDVYDEANESKVFAVEGFIWGRDHQRLLQHIPYTATTGSTEPKFDIVIASDLLFNHSEHGKLAATIRSCLSFNATARALIFFAPHRPWLFERDLGFFKAIRARFRGVSPQLKADMEAAWKRDEQNISVESSERDTSAALLQDLESLSSIEHASFDIPSDEHGASPKQTGQLNFELVFRQTFDQGMFEDEGTRQKDRDQRDSRLRRTVFGFAAWWDSA